MTYQRVDIALAYWNGCLVPAHTVYLSVPWIHPRLRRRIDRRGRR
jgi:hypothetical protein